MPSMRVSLPGLFANVISELPKREPDWPRDLARMESAASGEPMAVIGNLLPLLRPLGADDRRLLAQVRIGTALDCIAAGDVAAVRALLVDALDLLGAGEGGGR